VLRSLQSNDTRVTVVGMWHIVESHALHSLQSNDTRITDVGMWHIVESRVKYEEASWRCPMQACLFQSKHRHLVVEGSERIH
jgi:hypothetical protein